MRSPSARLRELAQLARDDADALREILRDDAGPLGAALGVPEHELRALAERGDDDARLGVRRILDHLRRQSIERQAAEREQRAVTAAQELALTARWFDVGVELDPRLMLGDLLADGSKPWIALMVDGADVVVSRARLRRAASALRPFQDLHAFVDPQALRLRWRGGRGGLNFRSQAAHVHDESLLLRVVIERPKMQPGEALYRPTPVRASSKWLTDAFAEFVG